MAAAPTYELPDGAIAQTPIEPRDAARLLVDRGPASPPDHRTVRELPHLLREGDVLVVNETRVLPARLRLRKATGGAVEVLLLEERSDGWTALVRPGRRLQPGTVLDAGDLVVRIGERIDGGARLVQLESSDLAASLAKHGEVPLPPYITVPLDDPERYQTVYAAHAGSVAAPTAGLHLTDAVLDDVRACGIDIVTVDLHVGLDTFRPVTAARIEDHEVHAERYSVPQATLDAVDRAERVVAVGTTTVRALESAYSFDAPTGSTRLLIHGDYRWKVVDALLTNFHLPRSTLLLLVESFIGPRWRDLYAVALRDGYRFLSFGDAMFLERGVRLTEVITPHGSFATPCFMPVGTRGAVKHLTSADLELLGAEIVLANTYHLMLRPGPDVVAGLGGLHGFMAWDRPVLTDSGGFQVFSLTPDVDDDGVTFESVYDGSRHRLTPERAVEVQAQLGADIQMVLDVCPALPASNDVLRLAVERTASWAARARATPLADGQQLFGIVQGGTDEDLRRESARRTVDLDFDGYGIGGLSVGESRTEMLPALAAALDELPTDKPRYLMGVGDPVAIVEAIGLGVDMFDCVLPTRLARHGTLLTGAGRVNLRNARWATSDEPPDPSCPCSTCARYSKAYLRHLLLVGEPTAGHLLTVHNLSWLLDLVRDIRAALAAGTFEMLRRGIAEVWG